MSNDLELPDSPKTVIRTYSNAARGSMPPTTHNNNNNLFKMAINNNINSQEEFELKDRCLTVDIEIHSDDRNRR